MKASDVKAAYRWPWDMGTGGKYAAANDDDWTLLGGVWTHRTDLASTAAYWKKHGWALP